jgi:hypothetical protein
VSILRPIKISLLFLGLLIFVLISIRAYLNREAVQGKETRVSRPVSPMQDAEKSRTLDSKRKELKKKISELPAARHFDPLMINGVWIGLKDEADRHPALKLTDAEVAAIQNIVIDLQLVSGELKASAAKINRGDNGKIEITIPARPVDAELLSDMLYEEIGAALSPGRSAQIKSEMEYYLVSQFYGFGACEETYTFSPSPVGRPRLFEFTYLVSLATNGVADPGYEMLANYGDARKHARATTIQGIEEQPQFAFLDHFVKP